ncbi:LytTR family DNA-binding domain-containing protein [Octadecabacter ascidiaceicola]|uniref:LytTR family DNA-binding domain-containing protein n=1 Tax=Octadecabacter ascidiaceicola TaxID=1655543 RepID=UPI001FEA3940|nr:LytTR family DNA-binding domain-containing protein [Octadecabacter ascidiaceicola]
MIEGINAIRKEVVTRVHLVVWVATTFIVSIAGPFGTYEELTLPIRISYWGGVILLSMVLALFLRVLWRIVIKGDPAWLEDLMVISSLAIIFGPMVATLNSTFWPTETDLVGWAAISVVTFAIGVVTVGSRRLIQRDVANMDKSRRDRLLDRVEAPSGARLARVYSDNHHIRVITSDGSEHRLLMRLRDAVAEIDVEPGLCVHRSHWVATASIVGVKQAEGREVVELPCGTTVPIGPKYRPNLIKAGMLTA